MVRERLTHSRWTAAAGVIAAFALVAACGPAEQQPASSAAPVASTALTLPARGGMRPMAIPAERVDAEAAVAPGTVPVFNCQRRASLTAGRCYNPDQMRHAYQMDAMLAAGYDGRGQTIVILDAFGSPTALADLQTFSTTFGLPAPDLTIVYPQGAIDWTHPDGNMLGWAEETSLDLQWSHALAPGAKLVLVAAKDNSDDALAGAFKYILDNKLGNIVSESFGEAEYWLVTEPGRPTLKNWESLYARAVANHVGVYVSSGDQGVATEGWPYRMPSYPATSPNVTSVGGTQLDATPCPSVAGTPCPVPPAGTYASEVVWNEYAKYGAAGGGGPSTYFMEPVYQWGLPAAMQATLQWKRGQPDVAYNGAIDGGVLVYLGLPGIPAGFYRFGGTSAGAPQWAAVAAVASQLAGHPLGFLNPRLYFLGSTGILANLHLTHDITVGDNHWDGIAGYPALPGYDLSTGWGSPSFGDLVSKLALLPDNPR